MDMDMTLLDVSAQGAGLISKGGGKMDLTYVSGSQDLARGYAIITLEYRFEVRFGVS